MHELTVKGYSQALLRKRCRLQLKGHPCLYGASAGLEGDTRYKHARGLFREIEKHWQRMLIEPSV